MHKKSTLLFLTLILPAVIGTLIANPSLRTPHKVVAQSLYQWKEFIGGWNKPDLPFDSQLEPWLRSVIHQTRSVKHYFYIPLSDHVWEPEVVASALPKTYVSKENLKYVRDFETVHMIGPHPLAPAIEPREQSVFWQRWLRMGLAVICWIGATAFLSGLSLPMRILSGAFVTGWGLWLVSWLLSMPLNKIYNVWVPLSLIGFVVVCWKYVRSVSRHGFLAYRSLLLCFVLFPNLWISFFTAPLAGPDARSMWFHRYKFEFLFGFIPQDISRFMYEASQRDYPWFLGGAVGIASWRDTQHFGGWNENAAFGTLVFLVWALIAIAWDSISKLLTTNHMALTARLFLIPLAFLPFAGYMTNGYMDFFWIISFGLFLLGYFSSCIPRRELWLLAACAASFKNEGVACLSMFLIFLFLYKARISVDQRTILRTKIREIAFWTTAMIIPWFQKIYLASWGIADQYQLGNRIRTYPVYDAIKRWESLHRFLIKEVFMRGAHYVVPLVLVLTTALLSKQLRLGWKIAGLIYGLCLPIFLVYVYTPHDQDWQLVTSGYRVFMLFPIWGALGYFVVVGKRLQR